MGKYGKRVEINLSPLAYNIGIIGSSGIGKSTLAKQVCEKLAGEEGYIALNTGKEDGHSAIAGINSEDVEDWDKFTDIVDDIVDNKIKEYPELKVVIIDTIDDLFLLAEEEVIRLYNRENPDKRATGINAVYGGYGRGLDMAIELVLNKLWSLKTVGVAFIVIGHTKIREVQDATTGQTYVTLTTAISQKYFNAIKTKLHVLGVAAIDREIVQQKTGKKNIATKKEETRNVVANETRIITFRDDNYTIDSKSRFADIVDSIPLDADEFIKAINDAIIAAHSLGSKTIAESKADADAAEVSKLKEIAKMNAKKNEQKQLKELLTTITDYIKENRSDMSKVKPLLDKSKELGFENPTKIDNIEDMKTILELIN